MVCYTEKSQSCSGEAAAPCKPGTDCPMPKPPVCEEQVRQLCVPRYVLPCVEDNDCGAGFSCKEQELCMSAGSGGAGGDTPKSDPGTPSSSADAGMSSARAAPAFAPPPASDAGKAPPAGDPIPANDAGSSGDGATDRPAPADASIDQDAGQPISECHPTGRKDCILLDISCTQDSDCPAQFSCQTIATTGSAGVACARPADAAGNADAAACADFAPPPVTSEIKRCAPPYANAYRGASPGVDKSSSEAGGTVSSTAADGGVPRATPTPDQQPAADPTAARHVEACSVALPGADRRGRDARAFALMSMLTGLVWLRRRRS
jgi:hypothetical protein